MNTKVCTYIRTFSVLQCRVKYLLTHQPGLRALQSTRTAPLVNLVRLYIRHPQSPVELLHASTDVSRDTTPVATSFHQPFVVNGNIDPDSVLEFRMYSVDERDNEVRHVGTSRVAASSILEHLMPVLELTVLQPVRGSRGDLVLELSLGHVTHLQHGGAEMGERGLEHVACRHTYMYMFLFRELCLL
jgi:hypothetical protein